jgi:hypothetical protein
MMTSEQALGAEIDALNLRVKRRIGEIQRDLLPDLRQMVAAQEAAVAAGQPAAQPPQEKRLLFSLRTAMAIADLGDLRDSLSQYLDLITEELRRRNHVLLALAAYRRSVPSRVRKTVR